MEHKVDTRRIDKRSSKKDRTDGPYSAKHIRNQEKILSSAISKGSGNSAISKGSGNSAKTKCKK